MSFIKTATLIASFAAIVSTPISAAPLPSILDSLSPLSDPVQATYLDAINKVKAYYDSEVNTDTGNTINSWFDTEGILYGAVGKPTVDQIDVLADRLCVGQANQGAICDELFAYAYTFIIAQEQSMTFGELANIIGANGVNNINTDLQALCIGPENDNGLCQNVQSNLDNLANSIVGATDAAENNGNSDTLTLLGLREILPPPNTQILL